MDRWANARRVGRIGMVVVSAAAAAAAPATSEAATSEAAAPPDAAVASRAAACRDAALGVLRKEATIPPAFDVTVVFFKGSPDDPGFCPAEAVPEPHGARRVARFLLPPGEDGVARLYAAVPPVREKGKPFFVAVEARPGEEAGVDVDARALGGRAGRATRHARLRIGEVARFGAREKRSSDTCVVLEVTALGPDEARGRLQRAVEEAAYVPAEGDGPKALRRGTLLDHDRVEWADLTLAGVVDDAGRPEWMRVLVTEGGPPLSVLESILYSLVTTTYEPARVDGRALRSFTFEGVTMQTGPRPATPRIPRVDPYTRAPDTSPFGRDGS